MRKTDYPCISEDIEPAMAHIVGHLYAQYTEAKNKDDDSWDAEDALIRLWTAVKAINRLSIVCDTPHFSVAAGNELHRVASLIKSETGFDPIIDNDPKMKSVYSY